jgi:opacity protein-like surface antigen
MLEYTQPFANGWSVMPLTRYYTQTAADFYIGLDPANPLFSEAMSARYKSLDQRLGEFGAWTWGIKVAKQLNENWLVDFKYEQYKQKESWALSGNGNGTIEPFNFRSYQVGISRKF